MPLRNHLAELRRRVLVTVAALAVATVIVFVAFDHVLAVLLSPYCHVVGRDHACDLYATGPLDGLSIRVKVAVYGGIILASPIAFWQFWRFAAPGLHTRERRGAVAFVITSAILFLGGAAVAFTSFDHALSFLSSVGGPSLRQIYSPSSYVGLLVVMMVAFGVAFELPVVLVVLQLAGVVTSATLASCRRWAIVGLVTLAAIVTPSSDPFSMLALAIPLVLFYEMAIIAGRILTRRQRVS